MQRWGNTFISGIKEWGSHCRNRNPGCYWTHRSRDKSDCPLWVWRRDTIHHWEMEKVERVQCSIQTFWVKMRGYPCLRQKQTNKKLEYWEEVAFQEEETNVLFPSQNSGGVVCLSNLKISLILKIHLVKNNFLLKLGKNFSEVNAKDSTVILEYQQTVFGTVSEKGLILDQEYHSKICLIL